MKKHSSRPYAVTLLMLVVLVFVAWGTQGLFSAVAPGEEAPNFQVRDLSGNAVELEDNRGKVVMVNIWATWCAPCLEELPMFESVHNRIGHEVTFLGVNVSDSPTRANELIADAGISYQMGRDPEGNFLVGLGIVGLPATVFIDSEGTIVDVHMGQISDEDLDKKISWVHK